MPLPRFAWPWIAPSAVVALTLHALASGPRAYGYASDELYYVACSARLAWGYVDQPPFSIAVLAVLRALAGDSLQALHLLPALLHAVTIFLVGALARELGGGRLAQALAGLVTLVCPVYLADAGFYSMNAFEPALWALATFWLARIGNGAPPRTWVWLGLTLGVGLLNKISMLWLGGGLGVALLATRERRWLATRWPWIAAALALVLFLPHIAWQMQNDWPTLEFMRNATGAKMTQKSVGAFLSEQLVVMHPLAVPVWLAGAVWLAARPSHRSLVWIWAFVLTLLALSQTARANYSGPAYVGVLAAGGVAWERIGRLRFGALAPWGIGVLLVLGLAAAPLSIPLLSPAQWPAYAQQLGVAPPQDEKQSSGPLPIHLAFRLGWPELTDAVARAFETLSPEERAHSAIFSGSYGEAAALEFFGPARGLPRSLSGHNSYWLWGPGQPEPTALLVVANDEAQLQGFCGSVTRAAEVDCTYCTPSLDARSVFVCRDRSRPLRELWPELKHYD